VLDKTGSLSVSFPVQIIYRIVSYRIQVNSATFSRSRSSDKAKRRNRLTWKNFDGEVRLSQRKRCIL